MKRLLRWFSAAISREAEENIALRDSLSVTQQALLDAQQENALLNDRLDAMRDDRTRLWGMVESCLNGERVAYQMHINKAWQEKGGGVPYPDAPYLPATAVPQPQEGPAYGGRRHMAPSQAIAEATAAFARHYASPGS